VRGTVPSSTKFKRVIIEILDSLFKKDTNVSVHKITQLYCVETLKQNINVNNSINNLIN